MTSAGWAPTRHRLEEVRRELIDAFWLDEETDFDVRFAFAEYSSDLMNIPFQSLRNRSYEVYTPSDKEIYYGNNDFVFMADLCEIKDETDNKNIKEGK